MMRQIIPFKKELLFKTKISEITSISLEHTLRLVEDNLVSGEFHISGDYKMTEASINREKFYFTLPFEIDLDDDYIVDSVSIDIDNFYYEVVNDDSLQVNIDVFVDGEKKKIIPEEVVVDKEAVDSFTEEEVKDVEEELVRDVNLGNLELKDDNIEISTDADIDSNNSFIDVSNNIVDISCDDERIIVTDDTSNDRQDSDSIDNNVNNNREELEKQVNYIEVPKVSLEDIEDNSVDNDVINNNFNFFNTENFGTDTYVTYYVYIVKEDDTINSIMDKFNVSKEEIANYNDISDIKKGTKLIIPTSNYNE